MGQITLLLQRYKRGDESAKNELFEAIYGELRGLAAARMRNERAGHTLQPTILVAEAYQRLAQLNRIEWKDRSHFLAVAAIQMKRVLQDYGRYHNAEKHGGGRIFVDLSGFDPSEHTTPAEVEELHGVLDKLEQRDPRIAKVIWCRFFAGMTVEETASELGVSEKTVRNDWDFGRAWLLGQLTAEGSPSAGA